MIMSTLRGRSGRTVGGHQPLAREGCRRRGLECRANAAIQAGLGAG